MRAGVRSQKSEVGSKAGSTALLALALALCGCNTAEQRLRSELYHEDGTYEVRESVVRVTTRGDARQLIDKLRTSNGKTQSIGMSGLEQESTSTNVMDTVERVSAGMMRGAVQAIVPVPVPK